ncbi:MAG: hypothetical protein IKQ71_11705 [Lachnospiraceae bacterium]|nr:hypothetical protein [Lachnospiraceae bacterium]
MRDLLKKIGLAIAGLLQGTLGSYFALIGIAFAFPETEPSMKDYEEDMFFVPFGYFMMLVWVAVMISAIILLRKNKLNTALFFISWLVGLLGCLIFVLVIH